MPEPAILSTAFSTSEAPFWAFPMAAPTALSESSRASVPLVAPLSFFSAWASSLLSFSCSEAALSEAASSFCSAIARRSIAVRACEDFSPYLLIASAFLAWAISTLRARFSCSVVARFSEATIFFSAASNSAVSLSRSGDSFSKPLAIALPIAAPAFGATVRSTSPNSLATCAARAFVATSSET